MKNSALFEALKFGSPQGAPESMSNTPTAPPPTPPLPQGGGNPLFQTLIAANQQPPPKDDIPEPVPRKAAAMNTVTSPWAEKIKQLISGKK